MMANMMANMMVNDGINNGIICLVIWNLIFMTYLGNNDPN